MFKSAKKLPGATMLELTVAVFCRWRSSDSRGSRLLERRKMRRAGVYGFRKLRG
jgi:hypothetical protein